MNMRQHKAFLIIDVQNDFCPGGNLAVPEGDTIVPPLNKYILYFINKNIPVLASRDWHSEKTKHFKKYGGDWPDHCVQGSQGAAFHPDLMLPEETIVLSKGMDPDQDGYSVFEAMDLAEQNFLNLLSRIAIKTLYIGGLATEHCIQSTVLDALEQDFGVYLLGDAIKGIDLKGAEKAIDKMIKTGAKKITYNELIKEGPAHV